MAKKPSDGSGVSVPANQDREPRRIVPKLPNVPSDKVYDYPRQEGAEPVVFPSPAGAKVVTIASRQKTKKPKLSS